jgi:serine/threonine-protein kinase
LPLLAGRGGSLHSTPVESLTAAGAAVAADGAAPPGEAPPGEEPGGFWTRNRLIAAALVALALAGGIVAFLLTRGSTTTRLRVPDVTGELQQQATRKLRSKGFAVEVSPVPRTAPVGQVVEQRPRAGTTAKEGATVTLFVSTGPGLATVPDVVGRPVADAIKALRKSGFDASVVHQYSSAGKGQVIDQEPPAKSHHARGTSVTLTVSKGRHLVTVPSLVGQPQADAETAIREAGLTPRSVTQNADQPAGVVINEDPSGGSSVPAHSSVTLTVSNGAGTVIVPNVVGRLQASAEAALRSHGVTRITVVHKTTTDRSEDGRVLDQTPSGGTRIQKTIGVTIFVGRFRQTSTTPSTTTTTTTTTSSTTTTTP